MTDRKSIRAGKLTTLQFHPAQNVFELVGIGHGCLFPPHATERRHPEGSKVEGPQVGDLVFLTVLEHYIPGPIFPGATHYVVRVTKRLGVNHETVEFLGEFGCPAEKD